MGFGALLKYQMLFIGKHLAVGENDPHVIQNAVRKTPSKGQKTEKMSKEAHLLSMKRC